MNIKSIIRERDNLLLAEYLVSLTNIYLTRDEVEYCIKNNAYSVFNHPKIHVCYNSKMLIYDAYNIYLFKEEDMVKLVSNRVPEKDIIRYMSRYTPSGVFLRKCYDAKYFEILTNNNVHMKFSITDIDSLEFGTYMLELGKHEVRFCTLDAKHMRKFLASGQIKHLISPITLELKEVDYILEGQEDKLDELLSYCQTTPELLDYVCTKYECEGFIDKHVTIYDIHNYSENVLRSIFFGTLYMLYADHGGEQLFQELVRRKDIPNMKSVSVSLYEKTFDRVCKLIEHFDIKVILYIAYNPDQHDFARLRELFVKRGDYIILTISTSFNSIPNILFSLEYSDALNSMIIPRDYTSTFNIGYYCRLFPKGLEKFYNNYVKEGPKLLQYYYNKHMNIQERKYSYSNDINIITTSDSLP